MVLHVLQDRGLYRHGAFYELLVAGWQRLGTEYEKRQRKKAGSRLRQTGAVGGLASAEQTNHEEAAKTNVPMFCAKYIGGTQKWKTQVIPLELSTIDT